MSDSVELCIVELTSVDCSCKFLHFNGLFEILMVLLKI